VANLTKPETNGEEAAIKDGESCKNNGCKESYGGDNSECKHHPGVPVFHEVHLDKEMISHFKIYFPGNEILVLLSEEDIRVSTLPGAGRM
jgi:hypothetical protein